MGENEILDEKRGYAVKSLEDYIVKYKDELDQQDLEFLIRYLYLLKHGDSRPVPLDTEDNIFEIIQDLKALSISLKEGSYTSICHSRFERMVDIFDTVSKKNIKTEDLSDASYELDKLFIENDMPLRKNSTLINRINNYDNDHKLRY